MSLADPAGGRCNALDEHGSAGWSWQTVARQAVSEAVPGDVRAAILPQFCGRPKRLSLGSRAIRSGSAGDPVISRAASWSIAPSSKRTRRTVKSEVHELAKSAMSMIWVAAKAQALHLQQRLWSATRLEPGAPEIRMYRRVGSRPARPCNQLHGEAQGPDEQPDHGARP